MLINRLHIALLTAGIGAGAILTQVLQPTSAIAQSHGMMSPSQCTAMRQEMMSKMHGPADMAMMQAMMHMHQSMEMVKTTGNADRDFLAMMIPHHQSAVDSAKVELRYGKDPKVRALAQRIIKSQSAEIVQMRSWLSQ